MNDINGILLVYKEPGPTSFAVVDKLKKLSGANKAGHTGTLDPMAKGLLVVCFGRATKTIRFMASNKEYETVMQLGVATDTLDKTGKPLKELPYKHITRSAVEKVLPAFRGRIQQVPPMFSALKKDGKRLYELARQGKTIERAAREVEISSLEMTGFDLPYVYLKIACSGGTYIRSLCDDIGRALGCGGVMHQLTRTRIGDYKLSAAVKLGELKTKEDVIKRLLPIEINKPQKNTELYCL
jgi:tRNA pseudouridine55 synthase